MSKQEQVLQIEPSSELRFKGPFNAPVTSYMVLTNPSDKKVMFKIKTTAPKKYCVRPNSGIMAPNAKNEIAISLQPFLFDPAEKNKHKFMVQTVFAPDGDVNIEQLWKEITPEQLMDSKLKCVFEMPDEPAAAAAAAQSNESGAGAGGEDPHKFSPKSAAQSAHAQEQGGSAEAELRKAAQEVQQLGQEKIELHQENLKLKEEIMQLKRQMGAGGATRPPPANRYAPPVQEQAVPMIYIGLAVVLSLIGVILGKFAL